MALAALGAVGEFLGSAEGSTLLNVAGGVLGGGQRTQAAPQQAQKPAIDVNWAEKHRHTSDSLAKSFCDTLTDDGKGGDQDA
ncbi:MAG TPA: hypothetical protein VGO93_12005 [Candidatus Xenobia bacterium]|jgi:hypothetical protein